MAVTGERRAAGIGNNLLNAFLQQCAREGITSVVLEVRVSNHRAYGFYRRFGFQDAGPLPGYYPDGEDGILMTRNVV